MSSSACDEVTESSADSVTENKVVAVKENTDSNLTHAETELDHDDTSSADSVTENTVVAITENTVVAVKENTNNNLSHAETELDHDDTSSADSVTENTVVAITENTVVAVKENTINNLSHAETELDYDDTKSPVTHSSTPTDNSVNGDEIGDKCITTDINDNKIEDSSKTACGALCNVQTAPQPTDFKIWTDDSVNISFKKNISGYKQSSFQADTRSESPAEKTFEEIRYSDLCKSISLKSEMGHTPSFKRGVMCTSTPLQDFPPGKRLKIDIPNLSVIDEHENSSSEDELVNTLVTPSEIIRLTTSERGRLESKLTVFEKDKISMLLDAPDGDKLEDYLLGKSDDDPLEKSEDDQLTIKVNGNLTIVYENLEDRAIDEILLRDGDIEKELEDILEKEPDRTRILEKANQLKVFISNDNQENEDNNDPQWDILRKLETDEARYKAVRQLWMNLNIPDPKENLTAFNWRKRNKLGPVTNNVPPCTSPSNQLVSHQQFYCTDIFNFYERRLLNFTQNRQLALQSQVMTPEAIVFYNQLGEYQREALDILSTARREIEAVHRFYNNLRNRSHNTRDLMLLNNKERDNILAVDEIIGSYSSWYKN